MTELPIFVRLCFELAFDVCPVGIVDLKIFTIATGAIAKNPVYLKTNRTFSTLEFSIDFPLDIIRSDNTFSRRRAWFVGDVFRSAKGVLEHLLYFVDRVDTCLLERGLCRIF